MIEFHPLASVFGWPMLEGDERAKFFEDIKHNGLRQKIDVLDGMILDGRNRYHAALFAGLVERDTLPEDRPTVFRKFVPDLDGDPVKYVISLNLARRHLNESQRAMAAARLANLPAHRPAEDDDNSANLPTYSQPDAAAQFNVSPRLVGAAKAVQDRAEPELSLAVDQGRLAVSAAAQAATLPPATQRKIVEADDPGKAARTEIARHNRDVRLEEIVRTNGPLAPAMPTGRKFALIYADPPWQFDVWNRDTGLEKCPDRHYPTMTVEEICALPVGDLVAETALLYLWITVPKLNRMEEVFRAWGRVLCDDPIYGKVRIPWQYVSNFNWDKVNIGPGRWNRNQHEHLLVARIGDVPAPSPDQRVRSNYSEAATDHSVKPEYFLQMIERQFPQLPKIELFRRGAPRPGWAAWGNEALSGSDAEAPLPAQASHDPEFSLLETAALPSHHGVPIKTFEFFAPTEADDWGCSRGSGCACAEDTRGDCPFWRLASDEVAA
jgi:N6-adenosine-specific RNA methylase IME4